MFRVVLLSLLILLFASLFSACSMNSSKSIAPNQRAFEAEDEYIIYALRAEELQDYSAASLLFEKLFEHSGKKEYLYRSLENDLAAKESQRLLQRTRDSLLKTPDDPTLLRLQIFALVELAELKEAQSLAMKLAHTTQSADDYLLVGEILIKQGEFDLALRYLDSAYAKEYNEKILDKISIILYINLERQKDAIAYLETHTRVHGFSALIATRLIGFYSDQNNIEGLLSTYKRLYALQKSEDVAKKIIQIYTYKRDYIRLIDFLEESKSDDKLLLQLYISSKNYTKAYVVAQRVYDETADIEFLAQSAIYEYEASSKKSDKELLNRVLRKLEDVVSMDDSPIYLNYLGYLLIDHDIDVPQGIRYIEKVLQTEPDSAYYLDSLAWGYYKLGNCLKAQKMIHKVMRLEGGDNAEVLEHAKRIEECVKSKVKQKKVKK